MPLPNHAPEPTRLVRLDQARAWAMVMMVVFHACYDLNWLGFVRLAMLDDPFWLTFRLLIVTSFALVAGITLQLTHRPHKPWFGKRELQLLMAALLVSAVSALLFGSRWIYFGVLDFFLLATLITRPLLAYPKLLALAGLMLVLAGNRWGFEFMNPKLFNWIGLAAYKPLTEDYAPLIPWLGVLWLGVGMAWLKPHWWKNPPDTTSGGVLAWTGQHALLIYLLHQPVLLALLWSLRRLLD